MQKETSMRIEVEDGIKGCFIIKDSYDSDLESLTNHSLSFLEQQTERTMPRTLILSDSDNTEDKNKLLYADVQKAISEKKLQRIILIGEDLSHNEALFKIKNKLVYKTVDDFLASGFFDSVCNETILIKVTSSFRLNDILNRLRLLVHDTVLEIDFDALLHNVNYFKTKIHPDTKLMCMVKASAYGSGSIEVSKALEHYGCDYLAVAFANEGVELQQAGVQLPILVLDPSTEAVERMIEHRLEPGVFSFKILEKLLESLKKNGIKDYPIHIKIDSGMHRAGFEQSDLQLLIKTIRNRSEIKILSVYSHLAGADETVFDTFTKTQVDYFLCCTKELEENLGYTFMKHILNSSGIERFSQNQFDMVRLGIGLWGVSCTQKDLKNVCTLKTKILQIREVKSNETVGYSRKGKLTKDSKIALLPLGYADGIDRRLGNGIGKVFIHGKEFPIIGNICMDLMMIDVTGSDVKEGAEVTIFGEEQTISEIAEQLHTIPYEILTSIAPRVRRIYFRK